jgi:hypothetical protein
MKLPAAGRTTIWATAISVSAFDPHAAAVALGLAAAKEGFDLLHSRIHRTTVLSYIRAADARIYLNVDPSGFAPGVTLRTAPPFAEPQGAQEGAVPVPAANESSLPGAERQSPDSLPSAAATPYSPIWSKQAPSLG